MDYHDDWGLPGGHIEENEDMDDAIRRELFEECGVEPESLKKVDFFLSLKWQDRPPPISAHSRMMISRQNKIILRVNRNG